MTVQSVDSSGVADLSVSAVQHRRQGDKPDGVTNSTTGLTLPPQDIKIAADGRLLSVNGISLGGRVSVWYGHGRRPGVGGAARQCREARRHMVQGLRPGQPPRKRTHSTSRARASTCATSHCKASTQRSSRRQAMQPSTSRLTRPRLRCPRRARPGRHFPAAADGDAGHDDQRHCDLGRHHVDRPERPPHSEEPHDVQDDGHLELGACVRFGVARD